jgi:signal peptidase I
MRSAARALGLVGCLAAIHFAAGCDEYGEPRYPVAEVPTNAMRPLLVKHGELVAIDDKAYVAAAARIGDIVLFRAPMGFRKGHCGVPRRRRQACGRPTAPGAERLILRVIAREGDSVAFRDGIALVNGHPERSYGRTSEVAGGPRCAECDLPITMTVPPDHVFLAGDNRTHAVDSRASGPVPDNAIVGEVIGFAAD